jgi:hypothetical protein
VYSVSSSGRVLGTRGISPLHVQVMSPRLLKGEFMKRTRVAVLISMGFLVGVSVAYFFAPCQALGYLAVITAIASGTVVGLYSDSQGENNGLR